MNFAALTWMDTAAVTVSNPLWVLLRFSVGIAVVLGLLWLVARWFKRSNLGDYTGPGLRLVSRLPLSRSAQVVVVEIGGRMFLVGAADSAVTPIAELYDTEEMAAQLDSAAQAFRSSGDANPPVSKPFGQVLAKFSRDTASAAKKQSFGANTKDTAFNTASSAGRGAAQAKPPAPPAAGSGNTQRKSETQPRITEAQMDDLAAQIAAEFGVKKTGEPK